MNHDQEDPLSSRTARYGGAAIAVAFGIAFYNVQDHVPDFVGWLVWVFLILFVPGLLFAPMLQRLEYPRPPGDFEVWILETGDRPIHVLKVVRELDDGVLLLSELRLRAVPWRASRGTTLEAAEGVAAWLRKSGASVEIRSIRSEGA